MLNPLSKLTSTNISNNTKGPSRILSALSGFNLVSDVLAQTNTKSPIAVNACTLEVRIHGFDNTDTIRPNLNNNGYYDVYTTIKSSGCDLGISKVQTLWEFKYGTQGLFASPATGQSQIMWTPVCSGVAGVDFPCSESLYENFSLNDVMYTRTGIPTGLKILENNTQKTIVKNWMRPATWLQCNTYYPLTINTSSTMALTGINGPVTIIPINARILTGSTNCVTPSNTPTPTTGPTATVAPTSSFSPADYDEDGDVDLVDRDTFLNHYSTQNSRSNFDGIGGIDVEDYQWFIHYYQTQ